MGENALTASDPIVIVFALVFGIALLLIPSGLLMLYAWFLGQKKPEDSCEEWKVEK